MTVAFWFVIIGALFVALALSGSLVERLWVTASLLYLLVGIAIGPEALGLLDVRPLEHAAILERITEVSVIVSLFTAGLKLRTPLSDARWHLPVRLASGSMILTVGLVAVAGVVGLGLPLGAAVLLGAILAPTDPVLAAEVQLESPYDRDRLRFSLTGEAGLNDGTAFPFVMLGLGLLGLHELGDAGSRWVIVDVIWATTAGLATGGLLGALVASFILYLRREHREAIGLDDFLALGLIALSYGAALLLHAYGFLAVFAAGLALRHVELRAAGDHEAEAAPPALAMAGAQAHEMATDPQQAPSYMAQAVLAFNEQMDRIMEVAVVLVIGALLTTRVLTTEALWFVPLLFLVIRPLSVWAVVRRDRVPPLQRRLLGWFGIRGVGSTYYLMYAIGHGLPEDMAQRLTDLTLVVVAASLVVHGISVTPLMQLYNRTVKGTGAAREPSRNKEAAQEAAGMS